MSVEKTPSRPRRPAAILLVWLAGCGAAGSAAPAAEGPAPVASEPGAPAQAPPGGAPQATPGEADSGEHAQAASAGPSLGPSRFGDDLRKIGLDPAALPLFAQLPSAQKKKLMPLLQKSLGFASCGGCHVDGNFKQVTARMKVASRMWDEFVVPLRLHGETETLFCDSCHAGKDRPLDRADRDSVALYMHEQYVGSLRQASGAKHTCKTCHGDPFEPKILENRWKTPH